MIFVDSNIPMYLVGAAHPNKDRTVAMLTRLVQSDEALVTDVEVYQEILHRYIAINRFDAIDPAFEALDAIVDDVLAFGVAEVRAARALVENTAELSVRDALHAAVMASAGLTRIFSFDSGFDAVKGLERLH